MPAAKLLKLKKGTTRINVLPPKVKPKPAAKKAKRVVKKFRLTKALLVRLKANGNWMIRMSNKGTAYDGFQWKPVGQWTKPVRWLRYAECGNGLHGQGPEDGAYGYSSENYTFELCETRGSRVCISGEKIKVPKARIIATDTVAFKAFVFLIDGVWKGVLKLGEYKLPLPEGLIAVWHLSLSSDTAKLPESLKIVGCVDGKGTKASKTSYGGFGYSQNHPCFYRVGNKAPRIKVGRDKFVWQAEKVKSSNNKGGVSTPVQRHPQQILARHRQGVVAIAR